MMNLRPAVKSEADQLAYLINLAGEGIPAVLWSQMAEPGETVQAVGTRRAAREQGNFSYRNARVCVDGDQIAGMIIDYRLDDPYDLGDLAEYPALVQPLVRLEAQVPGR